MTMTEYVSSVYRRMLHTTKCTLQRDTKNHIRFWINHYIILDQMVIFSAILQSVEGRVCAAFLYINRKFTLVPDMKRKS